VSVVGRELSELRVVLANIVFSRGYLLGFYINTALPPWGYQRSPGRRWLRAPSVLGAQHQDMRLLKGFFPLETLQLLGA